MKFLIPLLFVLSFSLNAFAGVGAGVVWEVRATGSSGNGGGWDPTLGGGGTDWSQLNGCKYSLTGITSSGAGNVILTTSAATDWPGNIIQMTGGTNINKGFYKIASVSAGVSATLSTRQDGTAVDSGVGAAGTGCIGGAYALGTSTDSVFSAGIAPGNTVWYNGAFTLNTALAFTDCTATAQCFHYGYKTSRGDLNEQSLSSNFPTINLVGSSNDFGSLAIIKALSFTGNATTPLTDDGQTTWINVKSVNTSTSSGHSALNPGAGSSVIGSELVSQAGNGLNFNGDVFVVGNYIHDTPTCIKEAANGLDVYIGNNILAGCPTNAINASTADTANLLIFGNTIYGSERKDGTAISIATSNSDAKTIGNIFYGWAAGISAATANTANYSNWNTFSNNTTNRTNWSTGAQDQTCAPGMTGVTTVSGTAGTVSGSTMTDAGASFANVVNNQDYLMIISGTGVTTSPGSILITSHTATSVTVAAAIGGTGTNISYFVRTGHNFALGTGCQALGYPAIFPAGLTTSYVDTGSVQRKEDYPIVANVLTGVVYGDSSLTGTSVNTDPGINSVLNGTTYTILSAAKTGVYVVPTTGQVKTGVTYGVSGGTSGTLTCTDPGITNVLNGTSYNIYSTPLTGDYVLPSNSFVKTGVTYGVSGGTSGTLTCTDPGIANVRKSTTYNIYSTPLTGTMSAGHSGGGFGSF